MPKEQDILKAYIFGEAGEDERSAIELRLMTDEDFFHELSLVEENIVQDYVDGNLTDSERANFERCFFVSEENRRKAKFARALRKYINENERDEKIADEKTSLFDSLKSFFSSPIPAALAVLIILSLGGFWIWKSFKSDNSEVLIALNKAYKTERPLESRITDFDYAPPKKTRGITKPEEITKVQMTLAESLASKAVLDNPTAENLHSLGRVYLAEKNFDAAIEQFEKALLLDSKDAKIHNDLGVSLTEKAKNSEEGELGNLTKASDEFIEAISLDKDLTEAYFNYALTLQRLNLHQAKEAWQKYLQIDPGSQWSDEARKNLETIETVKPVSKTKEEVLHEFLKAKQTDNDEQAWQTLSKNREMMTGKLIPQQLAFLFTTEKLNGNNQKAEEYLQALIYAGRLEEERSGDYFWRDLANFYSKLTDKEISVVNQAKKDYSDAIILESEGKLEKALNKFESASNIYGSVKDHVEKNLCDYWIGALNFRLNKLEKSENLFKQSITFANEKQYKWLATHCYVRLAFIAGSKNNHSESIDYSNAALNLARQTNDTYNVQRALYSLSYNYRLLKRYDLALEYSEKSLKIARENDSNLTFLWDIFDSITMILFEKKLNQTAIVFQKEALQISQDTEDKFAEHLSKIYLGMLYAKTGDYEEAKAFFEESRLIADRFDDLQAREKGLALINLKQGDLERSAGNYYKAIELLHRAGDFYNSSEYHMNEYESRKEELLCYFALNDEISAQKYIQIVLDIFKKYRTEILEEQNRNSFFDNEQSIYDLVIGYEYDKGNYENAFDYSEASKSRSLLDLLENKANTHERDIKFSKNISEPLSLEKVRAQIPDNVQIVQYSVLENKVLIWLIGKSEFSVIDVNISSSELNKKIRNYLETLSQKNNAEQQISEELYQLLIKPVYEKLSPEKQICIVADKFLFHLPFAALVSPETKRFLVTDFDLLFSPSINVFLASTNRADKYSRTSPETILAIGNPAFNHTNASNKDLPDLPEAESEARQIGNIYQSSKVLVDKETDKAAVKSFFSKSEIVHFAGHYVVDEISPMNSRFILKDDETLDNLEIFAENLSKTKLIILSACQTGTERYYQGEGMIGASRTFLAKGIPIVVASQWNVDSGASSRLMILFHQYRKDENISSVQALRKAQIDLINGENREYKNPYYWAAFQVFGGSANF